MRKGNLFATGLVAGGALAGVAIAFLTAGESTNAVLQKLNLEHLLEGGLGTSGYYLLGTVAFFVMAGILYKVASDKK